ncbi:MAG: divalent-cation tolerance protein CutA [Candidatus Micrarchaeota archaeon]|nr:divalent-cation tolerance protein CutA [Candidatus Micrarchaeota archaeon]
MVTIIYSPFPSFKSAKVAARRLLTARVIACANIVKSRSIYKWKGTLQDTVEFILIAKTTSKKKNESISIIKKSHPYELPAILTWSSKATPSFEKWVIDETKKG